MRKLLIQGRAVVRAGVSVLVLCGALASVAQDAAKPVPVKPMAMDADPDWEIATVKASDPNTTRGQHINLQGRHVMLMNTTVEEFLLMGYGMQKSQLAGLPDWAKTTRWSVEGVPDVEGQPSWKQLQVLMRKILTERFALQLHHEQREMPVFALTVVKGGHKMVVNTSDPNGWTKQNNGTSDGRHVENLTNASMADLVLILQFHVDRPIVNQTGLKGRYDLKLQWTINDATPEDAKTASDAPPGLFTAIQDQVGLKLERVKAPADVLVVDHATKPEGN